MFQHMNYIYEVYKAGSFSKAAKRLYMTQPALSIAVKKTEEKLGTPLFERGTSPLRLTDSGKKYILTIQKIYEMEAELKDELQKMEQARTGKIVIGAASVCMTYLMPEVLELFSQKYPGIEVEVREESFDVLKNMIRDDEIDLIMETDWYEDDLASERLFQNYVLLAVPKQLITNKALLEKGMTAKQIKRDEFLLPDAEKITLDDVIDIPFLTLQPRNEIYMRSTMIFHYYGKSPKTKMTFNQQNTAYQFARRGFGAALVSDTVVRYADEDENILFYQFDYLMPERWISIGYKKRKYQTKATKAFIETAKEVFQS
ncbi:MAG: LysR family transcriptional regulator [Lachnospiraceae bacterium]|nr:LysR family transcriptional regulator [Lachnospiraceae bacterium]